VWCPGQNKRIAPLSSMDVVKGDLRIVVFTIEINCDQKAMDLPPVTSAVLLIAK
jgi:hypothetical protein